MEMNWKRLAVRISSTLRAKQFLVFFAIALIGIDLAASLLTSYLREPRQFSDVFQEQTGGVYALLHWPSPTTALIVGAAILLIAWLRCGYIRSLVGSLNYGPASAAQFLSMLGLLIATDLLYGGLEYLARATSINEAIFSLLQLAVLLILLYADYAIIISAVDPARAVWRSLQAVGRNPLVSLGVVMVVVLLQMLVQTLVDQRIDGGFAESAGGLVLHVIAFGVIAFLTDVVLVSTYQDSVERGVLPGPRQRAVSGATEDDESE